MIAQRGCARRALAGEASARGVAITICKQCGRGTRDGAGRELVLEPHEVEAALCDAHHIGDTHVGVPPASASQTIPPRIRRLVHRRAHGRCEAPGCRSAKYLEIHHIIHRPDGGTHDPSLMTLLCSAHHAAIHRGALRVSGTAPDHLEFRHRHATWPAPSTPAPSSSAPQSPNANLHADALDALRGLGFSSAQARDALAACSPTDDIETLLRESLTHLRPPVQVSRARETTRRYAARARCAASSSRIFDRTSGETWSSPRSSMAGARSRPADSAAPSGLPGR